ncbi:MAG: coenzyme F420-0:L-glutamate ligase [Actinobacteria bacterium]|nr:coenzyme F420-0:L-glutamate ligase [Actinomycetota bacterium]
MTALTSAVTLTPLLGFPEVRRGDDLVKLVLKALQDNRIELDDGDVLVVSSKIASKAMGLSAPLAERDDVVAAQTVRVVAERITPLGITSIVETVAGPVMAAAGVDASNTADDSIVLVLPDDPDAVAAGIRVGVRTVWEARCGNHLRLGVVLSDTAGRPWRIGQTDFALGAAGIQVVDDLRGSTDADGRLLWVTERCVADEIAAAADLVKGKTAGVPVAHIRGLGQYVHDGESTSDAKTSGARDLVRTGPGDWFSLGQAEAVRAALGVEPGSAEATAVGIPSMNAETVAVRASRALRVALLACPGASGHVDGNTVRLVADDDFALGVAATRAEVALHGEGLSSTLSADVGLTGRPSALIVFQ